MIEDKKINKNVEDKNLQQNDTPTEIKEEKNNSEKNTDKKDSVKENQNSDRKNFKSKRPFDKNKKFGDRRGNFKRPFRREKPEFEQKILSLRRVTRVMAGGRRFSFSVAVVVGDKKGRVGIGLGKSNDTTLAIDKAVRSAKKNMVRIKLNKDGSIPYDISAKYKASEVTIRPVKGKGLAAGGAVRTVLEYAGVKEAGAKLLTRSKNHINNARATIIALSPFSEKVEVSLQKQDRRQNNRGRRTQGRFNNKKPFSKRPFSGEKNNLVKDQKNVNNQDEVVKNNSN